VKLLYLQQQHLQRYDSVATRENVAIIPSDVFCAAQNAKNMLTHFEGIIFRPWLCSEPPLGSSGGRFPPV